MSTDYIALDLPVIYELARTLKSSEFKISDYEALRLAIELTKKDALENLGVLADILEGKCGAIPVEIIQE